MLDMNRFPARTFERRCAESVRETYAEPRGDALRMEQVRAVKLVDDFLVGEFG